MFLPHFQSLKNGFNEFIFGIRSLPFGKISTYRHCSIQAVNVGTNKKTAESKNHVRKARLLSSTKGEESRIELSTLFNPKLRKLKPRILRNACPCFRILMTIHLLTILQKFRLGKQMTLPKIIHLVVEYNASFPGHFHAAKTAN